MGLHLLFRRAGVHCFSPAEQTFVSQERRFWGSGQARFVNHQHTYVIRGVLSSFLLCPTPPREQICEWSLQVRVQRTLGSGAPSYSKLIQALWAHSQFRKKLLKASLQLGTVLHTCIIFLFFSW
jgi:hypothetical protein